MNYVHKMTVPLESLELHVVLDRNMTHFVNIVTTQNPVHMGSTSKDAMEQHVSMKRVCAPAVLKRHVQLEKPEPYVTEMLTKIQCVHNVI